MAYLYAISNFQVEIGTVNELVYGLMMQTPFFSGTSGKHPCGAAFYGAIAGNCWYRAQYILQDQKIGIYNDIPPKLVFFSQIFGDLIGVPFNYMSLRWVVKSKYDFLKGLKSDPMRQWTGQVLTNYNSNAIQYVVLGPKRVFEHYPYLPLGFLVGSIAPLAVSMATSAQATLRNSSLAHSLCITCTNTSINGSRNTTMFWQQRSTRASTLPTLSLRCCSGPRRQLSFRSGGATTGPI
ncbi:hypothetical protein KL918_002851 [Ogataea parapolymorpha]|nr:hypothetical protein KL918_002851 [Ogataea parapolymorpha]KAG7871798.1 hypothetical protein KL916_003648 [Ogataea parapolymorpha]